MWGTNVFERKNLRDYLLINGFFLFFRDFTSFMIFGRSIVAIFQEESSHGCGNMCFLIFVFSLG